MTTQAERHALWVQKREISAWMARNADRFVDRRTGEVNLTALVEAWDRETQDGGVTTDPDHVAWEIAVDVAAEVES